MATVREPIFLTAEEYGHLPADGRLTELVRGRIVEFTRRFAAHGFYLNQVGFWLSSFVEPDYGGEPMTWSDPIVDEVHRARDGDAARFEYDLRAVFRDLNKQEKNSSRRIVSCTENDPQFEPNKTVQRTGVPSADQQHGLVRVVG